MKNFIESVNYTLLREQKSALIDVIENTKFNISTSDREGLEGLLCLLDSLQDTAANHYQSNEIVFGKDDETNR